MQNRRPKARAAYYDWLEGRPDGRTKNKEIELHERLHQLRAQDVGRLRGALKNDRLELIAPIEDRIGQRLHGRILDLGCGTGYLSAWLVRNRDPEVVYALETTKAAVRSLIPRTFRSNGIPMTNVQLVRGSFNCLQETSFFDYIFAFGSLHHSSSLEQTLRSCAQALKPGGFLIAQEPAMDDLTPNQHFVDGYEAQDNFHGLETITHRERTDRFYRDCEYKTAIHHAGLDLLDFVGMEALMGLAAPECDAAKPRRRVLIGRRPERDLPYIPHCSG